MLIEKEVIAPGTYWYTDQDTGVPRKLDVTPELTQYWCEQGSKMLSSGLTVPVPCEHDFNAHPMSAKDKLLNNAGWVKEYRLHDGKGGKGDKLHAIVDIEDMEVYKKLPTTIRWTSPWINSFTDGQGKQWNNVISHLALTTRPRITNQSPFPSIAAALSMATNTSVKDQPVGKDGFVLSRATRLVRNKATKEICPLYPIAFSLVSGVVLGENEGFSPKKDKKPPMPGKGSGEGKEGSEGGKGGFGGKEGDKGSEVENMDGSEVEGMEGQDSNPGKIDLPPYGDPKGDVTMEELLCDLLGALGIHIEKTGNVDMFKRSLYTAAMTKIHELTNKAQQDPNQPKPGEIGKQFKQQPGSQTQQNPLIQQEQQPMYMSLEDINKITDPTMKTIALNMYNENIRLRAEMDAAKKTTDSLRDAKLKEANDKRTQRVTFLSRLSPKVKSDLEAMLALPSMALSMGDGGEVIDPLAQTLTVLEKGLSDMPKLLTTDTAALFTQPHPTDAELSMNAEEEARLVDNFARMMGCPPEAKKAS